MSHQQMHSHFHRLCSTVLNVETTGERSFIIFQQFSNTVLKVISPLTIRKTRVVLCNRQCDLLVASK